MAYPTPTLYNYRVAATNPVGFSGSDAVGYFIAEFSVDGGTTYKPLFQQPFQSKTEAFNAIGFVVGSEANFKKNYLASKTGFVPSRTTYSYPPA